VSSSNGEAVSCEINIAVESVEEHIVHDGNNNVGVKNAVSANNHDYFQGFGPEVDRNPRLLAGQMYETLIEKLESKPLIEPQVGYFEVMFSLSSYVIPVHCSQEDCSTTSLPSILGLLPLPQAGKCWACPAHSSCLLCTDPPSSSPTVMCTLCARIYHTHHDPDVLLLCQDKLEQQLFICKLCSDPDMFTSPQQTSQVTSPLLTVQTERRTRQEKWFIRQEETISLQDKIISIQPTSQGSPTKPSKIKSKQSGSTVQAGQEFHAGCAESDENAAIDTKVDAEEPDSTTAGAVQSKPLCTGCGDESPSNIPSDRVSVGWIACVLCQAWWHDQCVGVNASDYEGDREWICPRCPPPPSSSKINSKKSGSRKNPLLVDPTLPIGWSRELVMSGKSRKVVITGPDGRRFWSKRDMKKGKGVVGLDIGDFDFSVFGSKGQK